MRLRDHHPLNTPNVANGLLTDHGLALSELFRLEFVHGQTLANAVQAARALSAGTAMPPLAGRRCRNPPEGRRAF
jgi:hypothetical protein